MKVLSNMGIDLGGSEVSVSGLAGKMAILKSAARRPMEEEIIICVSGC